MLAVCHRCHTLHTLLIHVDTGEDIGGRTYQLPGIGGNERNNQKAAIRESEEDRRQERGERRQAMVQSTDLVFSGRQYCILM